MSTVGLTPRVAHAVTALLLFALSVAVLALAVNGWHDYVDDGKTTTTAILERSDGSQTHITKLPKQLNNGDAKGEIAAASFALIGSIAAFMLPAFNSPSRNAYLYACYVASPFISMGFGAGIAAIAAASSIVNRSPSFNVDDFSINSVASMGRYAVEAATCELRHQNIISGNTKSDMNDWCKEMMAARWIIIPIIILSFGLCLSTLWFAARLNPNPKKSSSPAKTELGEVTPK
ncbi:hypothetical protein K490DRAFT_55948 [Saccharata proteae CBS 121410]|uniref:Transmembrane protein n=1 Tax=Saccharata proteae CBS 121410 TaxID=1314787 RepID=A0A9P4HXZ9_9PEZI|nr:hypothetical protein K490DRAFT_55948 [Saccharata proteae CBS 121410]